MIRRTLRKNSPAIQPQGGFDRTHNGLISGWFICAECGPPPTPTPIVMVGGHKVEAVTTTTPRLDIPGGLGFLHRFIPTDIIPERFVQIQCPLHPKQALEVEASEGDWSVHSLGAIESSSWPFVTGWVANLSEQNESATIRLEGFDPITVQGSVRRPDVENYLGTQGVAGFQIDVGAILGYSVQDATKIVLSGPVEQLDTAFILDSPIGMNRNDCFPAAAKTGLDRETIENLSRRLRMAEVDSTSGDWREITCILGCEDNSAQSAQWAEYLADKDQSPKHIAAMQVQRMTNDLGVPALDPLPNSFESVLATKSYATSKNSMNPSQQTLDKEHQQNSDTHPRVAVAGLVHHKSGLGQNVRNSLAAFELAGIHACPLPFFPARGGWNSKLGMTQQAASSMADHSVQLHLPVDKVISALSAQPALLQTERLIGYFMWETETIPRQLHRALNVVDEIWTATDFVAEAFRSVSDTPVFITGHAVDVSKTKTVRRSDLGIDENAFVVHYAFDANSTVARKNPNAALDAFDLAFGNDPSTEFILKIRNMQQVESLASQGDPHAKGLLERLLDRPRVRVITRETTHSEALGLIQLADCFLSLHRSEGYGYGIAEAMALGTPVVATNYSGSLSLTNSETAWLIPFEHIDILPGEYFYWQKGMTWAEPDLSRAAESLVAIRRGEEQLGRVQSGARHVANTATLSALSANYASLMSADRAGLQQV